jgi:hypothetical protein
MVSAAVLWPSDADEEEADSEPERKEEYIEELVEEEESERARGDSRIMAG